MRLLVTGTTGGIGGAVKRVAVARGWQVVEVNRGEWDNLPVEGKFDGVVFATGMCPVKPLALLSDDEFSETLRVNCGLFVRLMRHLVSGRMHGESGMRVVAVSSVSASEGWAGGAAYCASKGALSGVCRAMNEELRSRGISVTAVEPRYVNTRMFEKCAGRMGVPASQARDPADLAREIIDIVSTGQKEMTK